MAGTEHYCTGYERTFHGEWTLADVEGSGTPILFRIGTNADGKGCYAQLNVMTPPGIAPYELPRFRAEARDGAWTLHYRDIVLDLDTGHGTAVRRQGAGSPWTGVLLARPPPVGDVRTVPPARQMERWYGKWRGRFANLPFPVTLQISGSGASQVQGKISALLMAQSFTGRFHGEMLIFRWRNRHVGLLMEPGGDTLVHINYEGKVFQFHRRR